MFQLIKGDEIVLNNDKRNYFNNTNVKSEDFLRGK